MYGAESRLSRTTLLSDAFDNTVRGFRTETENSSSQDLQLKEQDLSSKCSQHCRSLR